MTTVSNKREVLSVERKAKVIRQISNGKKKDDVSREFGVADYTIQRFGKTEPKLLVHLN
jgi:CENP-B N-terminal DNA-binding domain.